MPTLAARLEAAIAAMTPPPPRGIQADLARFCGISQPSVSNWFSGRTKQLKGEPLLKAARYLGVRPEWLADGSGPMKLSGVLPAPPKLGLTDALGIVCDAVTRVAPEQREALAMNLAGLARAGGTEPWRSIVLHLLGSAGSSGKRTSAA